jgi:predicted HicB family RNase H-like nuclease
MPKTKRSERLAIRVAGPLRGELELAAAAEGRSVSDYVRRLLIEHIIERPAPSIPETLHHG